MNIQEIIDYRKNLVDAGIIHKMDLGAIDLGYEWAAKEPDETDERIFSHIDRLRTRPHRILDLGCAHGMRLLRYAQTGVECVGVDILDTSTTINPVNQHLVAQQKPPITFIQSDVRKLRAEDYAAHKFTVINCSQVLHFMAEDDIIELLKFIKKIAKPDTLICISLDTVDAASKTGLNRQYVKMLWDERARDLEKIGRQSLGTMDFRCYTDIDIISAMQSSGLHLHGTQTHQSGWMLVLASAEGNMMFEQRPRNEAAAERIRHYLNLNR